MGFALRWHFQGPCACWMWLLSALHPHTLCCLLTSLCLTAPIPAWLMAHCTVQLRQGQLFPSASLFLSFSLSPSPRLQFYALRLVEWSQALPSHSSPSLPSQGALLPSPWHEMNQPPTAPLSPVLQQQLLGCFLPASQAGNTTARAAAFWRVKRQHKEQRLCATKTAAQGRKVQYVFILGLCSSVFPLVLPPH